MADATTKPSSVSPTVASANTGNSCGGCTTGACAGASRSVRKNRRNTTYSAMIATSHGNAISAANRVKLSPLDANASRFVRFDTGSSSDALLERCVHA